MPQILNEVQRLFIQETFRPHVETLIKIEDRLSTYKADYDAIQAGPDAFTLDAEVLHDNVAHDGPRDDAPQLTGTRLSQANTLVTNLITQIDAPTLAILRQLSVRDLATLLRGPGI